MYDKYPLNFNTLLMLNLEYDHITEKINCQNNQFCFKKFKIKNEHEFFQKNQKSLNINYNRLKNNQQQMKTQLAQPKRKRSSSNENDNEQSKSRSRSRQKPQRNLSQRPQTYVRKMNLHSQPSEPAYKFNAINQFAETESLEQKQKKDVKKQLLRSFMRIEQLREQPIDKFVKIIWIYKGRFIYDHRVHDIMMDPKKYLSTLSLQELNKMLPLAEGHRLFQHYQNSSQEEYWINLVGLIKYMIQKQDESAMKLQTQYQERIKQIILKPLPQLIKLEKQTIMILKTQAFGSNQQYWKQVLARIKVKRMQLILNKFYIKFKQENIDKINQHNEDVEQEVYKQPLSPNLVPFSSVNPKLIIDEQQQKESIKILAQKIFKQQFDRGRQRLQINLSLQHNHNLLTAEIVTEQTNTYDQITKEIIEFERYKRMEEDQEEFNDWVPCETQGRFREMKPVYINRVRVACEWNKYNSMHYNDDNPPPKTIQGYKFNVFYPDLYDKQKTPQYYLENTDDPNYCIIKFKAGPPYKDIAFKILKKEWDFTEKSGFESIFSKGILHLYFNFKKPRFRI